MIWLLLLLLALIATSTAAIVLLSRLHSGRNKHLLLSTAHISAGNTTDCPGISVLGCGVHTPEQVENLLSVECSRYEVVLVFDTQLHPLDFALLKRRYGMIEVDYHPTREFPAERVRGLYRSRKRGYRRLLILDREQSTLAADCNAAAGMASYGYLLPIEADRYLLAGAIERIMTELSEESPSHLQALRVVLGEPAELLDREAVIALGGFNMRLRFQHTRMLWEPILRRACTPDALRPTTLLGFSAAALVLSLGIVLALFSGSWIWLATLLTLALLWSCATCAEMHLRATAGVPVRLFGAIVGGGRKKFYN